MERAAVGARQRVGDADVLVVGDEVRRARERLQAAGLTETEWQDDGTFVRVQVADPDGYRVELLAH